MFSLRIKLFLAILLASALLIISLLTLAQWNFERGFGDYLERQQVQRLENIAAALANDYRPDQIWNEQDLRRQDRRPPDFRREPPASLEQPPQPDAPDEFRRGPPPPHNGRLFLLDNRKQVLVGRFDSTQDNLLQPIQVNGEIVGYVGQQRHRGPQEMLDKEFAKHQSEHLLLLAGLAGMVSLLVAFPLASLLVKRIERLLRQIQALSKGEFSARTEVRGGDELSQLALHLNALGQTLQQNADTHRTMVADISHELRTPIR